MTGNTKPEVASSTKVWVGSTVTTVLGLALGATLVIVGSPLTWRADGVLSLFNVSGWRYQNIIAGDGKITLALGLVMALGLVFGLLLQSRAAYMTAVVAGLLVLGLSIYELIYVATRSGITGPGHGLYMVLGGGAAGIMSGLCGYSMMADRRLAGSKTPVAADSGGVA